MKRTKCMNLNRVAFRANGGVSPPLVRPGRSRGAQPHHAVGRRWRCRRHSYFPPTSPCPRARPRARALFASILNVASNLHMRRFTSLLIILFTFGLGIIEYNQYLHFEYIPLQKLLPLRRAWFMSDLGRTFSVVLGMASGGWRA
jgi:hypothetical protein